MKKTLLVIFGCVIGLFFVQESVAQQAYIRLGENSIALNQYFTVTITIEGDNIKQHSQFPDIEGFIKRGASSSSSTSIVNGRVSSSHSITQNYQANNQGTYELRPFQMTINDDRVSSQGTQIAVSEPTQQRKYQAITDPFGSLFGRPNEPVEYVEVEADAFLALTNSQDEVYVGEGFTTTLAFYVSTSNRADMSFYDLSNQVTEIIKLIKPEQCWEENYNIENINGEPITLNGQQFKRYTIFQATYFPLSVRDITFPSVELELIKYNVARNPTIFRNNRQQDFETFRSRPKTVKVNPLPPHPLRESVAVGQFELNERIDQEELNTGESFSYIFDVRGYGNISAINQPDVPPNGHFDLYDPNTTQNVNRSNGRISGNKSFSYYGIPNEPGAYDLGDYFEWIYFNTRTDTYDTLSSEIQLTVTGESRQNEYILSSDVGSFYDRINGAENELRSRTGGRFMRWAINAMILIVLALTIVTLIRKF